MTTVVPAGPSDAAVEPIRAREAARAAQLAADGALVRLWRPPLCPGEWRTLGLFAASDADALETLFASMPLRVWRRDEVTPLRPYPNDPDRADAIGGIVEFLTTCTVEIPKCRADAGHETEREAVRSRELAEATTVATPVAGHVGRRHAADVGSVACHRR